MTTKQCISLHSTFTMYWQLQEKVEFFFPGNFISKKGEIFISGYEGLDRVEPDPDGQKTG